MSYHIGEEEEEENNRSKREYEMPAKSYKPSSWLCGTICPVMTGCWASASRQHAMRSERAARSMVGLR